MVIANNANRDEPIGKYIEFEHGDEHYESDVIDSVFGGKRCGCPLDHCDRYFTTIHGVKQHLSKNHSNMAHKHRTCPVCDKEFTQSANGHEQQCCSEDCAVEYRYYNDDGDDT